MRLITKAGSPMSHLLQILAPMDNQVQLLTISSSTYLLVSKARAYKP